MLNIKHVLVENETFKERDISIEEEKTFAYEEREDDISETLSIEDLMRQIDDYTHKGDAILDSAILAYEHSDDYFDFTKHIDVAYEVLSLPTYNLSKDAAGYEVDFSIVTDTFKKVYEGIKKVLLAIYNFIKKLISNVNKEITLFIKYMGKDDVAIGKNLVMANQLKVSKQYSDFEKNHIEGLINESEMEEFEKSELKKIYVKRLEVFPVLYFTKKSNFIEAVQVVEHAINNKLALVKSFRKDNEELRNKLIFINKQLMTLIDYGKLLTEGEDFSISEINSKLLGNIRLIVSLYKALNPEVKINSSILKRAGIDTETMTISTAYTEYKEQEVTEFDKSIIDYLVKNEAVSEADRENMVIMNIAPQSITYAVFKRENEESVPEKISMIEEGDDSDFNKLFKITGLLLRVISDSLYVDISTYSITTVDDEMKVYLQDMGKDLDKMFDSISSSVFLNILKNLKYGSKFMKIPSNFTKDLNTIINKIDRIASDINRVKEASSTKKALESFILDVSKTTQTIEKSDVKMLKLINDMVKSYKIYSQTVTYIASGNYDLYLAIKKYHKEIRSELEDGDINQYD